MQNISSTQELLFYTDSDPLTLTTLNPSKSIPLYWKILADSGYLHIEHVVDFDGFRISIVVNCLVMLVDGL